MKRINEFIKKYIELNKMLKLAAQTLRLTHKNKFNFVPPSCYNI